MNIFTAPLIDLLASLMSYNVTVADIAAGPAPGPTDRSYLHLGTLICLIVIAGGFYFIFAGTETDTIVSWDKFELKTGTAGIVLVLLGLLFYLGIGRILMRKSGS